MSSPAQEGPPVPKDKEKKGFGKVISRVKTFVKKAKTDRRLSTISTKGGSAAAGETSAAPAEAIQATETGPEPERIPRAQIFAERAKRLGELYVVELKPSDWHSSEGHVLRVEKPIKMRVHRKCHLCSTSFGACKECPNCKHPRCKQCPRTPPKRSEAEKEQSRKKRAALLKQRAENPPIIPDWDISDKPIVLKKPSMTGGQDLVHRKPRQRVRRNCCQCEKQFGAHVKACEGCTHTRCTDCPRDPPKKDKFPYGYPGDAPGTKLGHFQCHSCNHIYSGPPAEDTACPQCKHRNCASCERLKPKKVEPEPDPEVWKSVQAKLEELKLK